MIKLKRFLLVGFVAVITTASISPMFAQARRVVGVVFFKNKGKISHNWVAWGIEYLLYDKLKNINGVSVYEKETLNRVLKKLHIRNSADVDVRKAFTVGKFTGIEILFTGSYAVRARQIAMEFKVLSTYTGAPVFEKIYTGSLSQMFDLFNQALNEALNTIQIPLSDKEKDYLFGKPTASLKAFESYCKAYVEISRGSPMEMIAGYFQRAIQEDPNFWEAPYNLGVIYYNFDLYDKAQQQFERVIQKRGDFYKAYFGKGVIFYLQKKYRRAIRQFKTVVSLYPEHDRSYYYMGICYTRLDSLRKGIQSLEKSIELNPNYAPAYYQLGLADMRRRWFKKAIVSFNKAIKLNPDYYQAHNALGEAYYALNMFEEAIIEFQKTIQLQPRFATAYFNLGNAIYKKGALEEIVDAFWALMEIEIVPGEKPGETPPIPGTTDLAKLREKSRIKDPAKIYRRMVRNYRMALKYDRKFFEASYNLGLTYENLSMPDSAEYYYRMSIRIKPDLAQAHMRLGKLYEQRKAFDLALKEFEEVVKIEPRYFAANPKLGEPYRYVNIIDLVLQKFQARLQRNPRDREALKVVGRIYFSLGRFGQAEQYFQQLVEVNPNDRLARQTLREIRRKLRKL